MLGDCYAAAVIEKLSQAELNTMETENTGEKRINNDVKNHV